jgi:ribosomal protein L19E
MKQNIEKSKLALSFHTFCFTFRKFSTLESYLIKKVIPKIFTLECRQPLRLGMENGEIHDSQISASSEWDANHGAINSRLNFQAQGKRQGAWSARRNDRNQWLQVNFNLQATVTEILTQGRSNSNQWVTSYTVSYSNDGLNFFAYRVNGVLKVINTTYNATCSVVDILMK